MALTYDGSTSFEAEAVAVEQAAGFRPLERFGVVLGAGALGAAIGFGATMALGSLEPWVVAACAAPLFVAALHLTIEAFRETVNRREWAAIVPIGLMLAGMTVWPLAVFYAPPTELAFWAGPISTLITLAGFVLIASGSARRVYRAGALAWLIAVMAANQTLLTAMGA